MGVCHMNEWYYSTSKDHAAARISSPAQEELFGQPAGQRRVRGQHDLGSRAQLQDMKAGGYRGASEGYRECARETERQTERETERETDKGPKFLYWRLHISHRKSEEHTERGTEQEHTWDNINHHNSNHLISSHLYRSTHLTSRPYRHHLRHRRAGVQVRQREGVGAAQVKVAGEGVGHPFQLRLSVPESTREWEWEYSIV